MNKAQMAYQLFKYRIGNALRELSEEELERFTKKEQAKEEKWETTDLDEIEF